jgi:hypothetical protein
MGHITTGMIDCGERNDFFTKWLFTGTQLEKVRQKSLKSKAS